MSDKTIIDYASEPQSEFLSEAAAELRALIRSARQAIGSRDLRRSRRRNPDPRDPDRARPGRSADERQYRKDRPAWEQVWDDRFWERAESDDIARAWDACDRWARLEYPVAEAARQHMREEIADRYGIDVDELPDRGPDRDGAGRDDPDVNGPELEGSVLNGPDHDPRASESDPDRDDREPRDRIAALRWELDEGRWQRPSPEEAGKLWEHVGAWPPDAGRDDGLEVLRDGMRREFGVDVPLSASPATTHRAVANGLWRRSRGEDAESERRDDVTGRLDADNRGMGAEEAGRVQVEEQRRFAADLREAADQDRAAAAVIEGLDDEPRAAVRVAGKGFPANVGARLRRAAALRGRVAPAGAPSQGRTFTRTPSPER
ncbi:hypothetical protein BTM25_01390 [Actinomadura rubteroloni]|uniref:Uncharacterized protein n=1 Tax=Actinomadura rubteroloni TaxID=1926885 RepID=A0A2P4UL19_9ACTN|nr:hypothetical protein [Actinomadura rubteroloni]POM25756.1 hypothetical protein BTM25_01390 [Actinomadura rubteroloni]